MHYQCFIQTTALNIIQKILFKSKTFLSTSAKLIQTSLEHNLLCKEKSNDSHIKMSFQQELLGQIVPNDITLRQFQTQRLLTDHKDIGPWNTNSKRPTPRDLHHHKIQNLINNRRQNKTERASQNPEQQSVILKRFKTHVFEFVDRSKITQVYSLQKQRKPYAFRCFQLSSCLPQQKEVSLKNPVEPVYVSLLKYKKTKLKNKMNQIVNRLMKNHPKSITIPSLSQRYLQERNTKIASLGYQKINFKITSKQNKCLK